MIPGYLVEGLADTMLKQAKASNELAERQAQNGDEKAEHFARGFATGVNYSVTVIRVANENKASKVLMFLDGKTAYWLGAAVFWGMIISGLIERLNGKVGP